MIFEISSEGEKSLSVEVTNAYKVFQQLLPMIVSTPKGDVETEGLEMRPAEREIVRDILDRLDFVDRREGGFDYFPLGTKKELLD